MKLFEFFNLFPRIERMLMLKLHLQSGNTKKNTAKKIVEKQKQIAKKIRFPFESLPFRRRTKGNYI